MLPGLPYLMPAHTITLPFQRVGANVRHLKFIVGQKSGWQCLNIYLNDDGVLALIVIFQSHILQ